MKKQPINPALLSQIAAGAALKTQDVSQSVQASSQIACALIDPNPYQPRLDYDPIEVRALADSIEEYGLLQSIVVRRDGDRYTLVAGHTRLEAFKLLGRDTIPANIIDVSDTEMAALALIENVQRSELHPLEVALAISKEPFTSMNDDEISKILGYGLTKLRNIRSTLKLDIMVQRHIIENKSKIGVEILVELQKIKHRAAQWNAYLSYLKGYTTRDDIRAIVSSQNTQKTPKPSSPISRKGKTFKIDCDAVSGFDMPKFETELHDLITKYIKG